VSLSSAGACVTNVRCSTHNKTHPASLFECCFPYVRPEPVLVNDGVFGSINWHRK
jgi:hypothetical protein